MPTRHEARELALQLLYQFDACGGDLDTDIAGNLEGSGKSEDTQQLALDWARGAWSMREQADAKAAALAPDWPTHRQPMVDRNILRLSYYEMIQGISPAEVAMNEAIELAKSFGSDRSPAFINGVLDQIAQELKGA